MNVLVILFFVLLFEKCNCLNTIIPIYFLTSNYDNNGSNQMHDPTNSVPLQIIIFAAVLSILIVISLIICKICSRQLSARAEFDSGTQGRSSFDRLVRRRMEDCPPTYVESQRNVEMLSETDPPTYTDVMRHSRDCSVFTINKTTSFVDNADAISWSSDPPSYGTLEGITNPTYSVQDSDSTQRDQNRHITDERWNNEIYI